MLNNKTTYKYETIYNIIFKITQFWINGMVTLKMGAIKIRYNIRGMKTYKIEN